MAEMTKIEKTANLAGVVVPFVGTIVAIILLPWSLVSPGILAIALFMYLITAVGITVGFHRLLTHRSFQTSKWLEYTFAVLGTMAVQGPVLDWVADHRKHHAHTDKEGDPHSPHVGHGDGFRGLWHAHIGWLMETQGRPTGSDTPVTSTRTRHAVDRRRFVALIYLSLLIPAVLGFALTGPRWARSPASSGGPGAGLLRPPHHLERQLGVSLPRHAPLRHRRPVDQRRLAFDPLPGRVLAPQPPRLPPLRRHGLRNGRSTFRR